MVYPHKWSPISCRSSVGQGKFAGHRPTFYNCAMQPTKKLLNCTSVTNVMFLCQLQDSSADSSVMSDEAADHTLVELLETEVRFLLIAC